MITSRYSKEESFKRSFMRMALYLKDIWDEYNHNEKNPLPAHSRIFDVMMVDDFILLGQSVELQKSIEAGSSKKGYREHLVPCATLRDHAADMFRAGKMPEDVAAMLQRFLRIVHITREEADRLNYDVGLKNKMPDGWDWDSGDVKERLHMANIELDPGSNKNTHL